MSSMINESKIIKCQRTPDRVEILKLLAEYHCLTARQLHGLLQTRGSVKTLRRVQSDLQTLKQARLIGSFRVSPELGRRSELGWLLLESGARWTGLDLRYGNHFRRQPGPEQLAYTTWKLELEKAVASAAGDWQLEKPQTYNRVRPLPARTPQHSRLAEALTWREFYTSGRWPPDGATGSHILGVPLKANDFVAFTPPREVPAALANRAAAPYAPARFEKAGNAYSEQAVVLILCPPKAGEKFWLARIRQYQLIAGQLLVAGVFESAEKALNHKALLGKGGLRVTTLSRVRTILEDLWQP